MLSPLFFVALMLGGRALARALWTRGGEAAETPGPWESAASAGVCAMAIGVALDWSLALAHVFTRASLVVAAVAIASIGFARRPRGRRPPAPSRVAVIAALPCGAWVAYLLVRGAIVFPFASDALAYHLPKALLIARTHGYAAFDGPDARLTTFPADYEMLLADVLALDGSERLTAFIGVIAYVLLGVIVAAMAERWWGEARGGRAHPLLAALVALGMPTALLAAGAHKNDLLLAAFVLAAAHFAARWAARGERAALALGIAATALAIGTKPTGGVLLVALAPCVVWRARESLRDKSARAGEIAQWVAGGALAALLLGGAAYVVNVLAIGRPLGDVEGTGYGDWKNVWMFPLLVFLRGVSLVDRVWVPWKGETWFWPQYDLFFSSYGGLATLLLFAIPFFAFRRHDPTEAPRAVERRLATAAAVIAFVAVLPARVQQPPIGLFEGFVRYTLFLPPVIALWTFVRWARASRWAHVALLGAGGLLGYHAIRCLLDDQYAPIEHVASALRGDVGPREIRTWTLRAASYVDEHAAPDDGVAIDGAFDAWVYPAYGRALRRPVVFLHGAGTGPVVIPDDVKWVAVDRSWSIAFGHPLFVDFGVYERYTLRGDPLPEDLAVFRQLLGDPRFRLVYRDRHANQAVFERVARR